MPSVKPLLKISEAQRKALLRRIVLREADQVGEMSIPRNAGIDPRAMTSPSPANPLMGQPGSPMSMTPPSLDLNATRSAVPARGIEAPMGTSHLNPEALQGAMPDPFMYNMKQAERIQMPHPAAEPWSSMRRPDPFERMPSPIDEMMSSAPESEKVMGRLGVEGGVLDYPLAEAKLRYLKNPSAYSLPRPPSEVRHLRATDDIEGVAYERVKFKPVLSSGERNMAKVTEKELSNMNIPESATQTVKPKVTYGGKESTKAVSSVVEASQGKSAKDVNVLETAVLADSMWKHLGGGTSANGRMWKSFNDTASDKAKRTNAREYFVARMLEWQSNPEWFKRRYPREAKHLDVLWNTMNKEQGAVQ